VCVREAVRLGPRGAALVAVGKREAGWRVRADNCPDNLRTNENCLPFPFSLVHNSGNTVAQ
jgi:hypothetical protein